MKKTLREEWRELIGVLTPIVLIILPGIVAYYFCRDYPGRGNSPENAPMAAVVAVFVWIFFYLSVRDFFGHKKWKFDLAVFVVFALLAIQVTLLNPKF